MKNTLKLLEFFVENKNKTFTIRKAAEALKINYKIAYEEIKKLEKEGLLLIERQGNVNVCSFAYRYDPKIAMVEDNRIKRLSKDIKLILNRFKEIESPFYCFLLFGSHSASKAKKGSDVDLCVIADDSKISKKIDSILSITPLDVHLLKFTSQQFLQMIKKKELNVGNEIMNNNIVLHGIEAFYELVNCVG